MRLMAGTCARCGSSAIRQDRSLAGRSVCGACGLPVGSSWSPSTGGRRRRRGVGGHRRRLVLVLLLPAMALGAGGLLMHHQAVSFPPFLRPPSLPTPR